MQTLSEGFDALVIGSSGGIGSAVADELAGRPRCGSVERLSRNGPMPLDLTDETTIAAAATKLKAAGKMFDLIFDATGALTFGSAGPEKSLSALEAQTMAQAFAVNVIGPALLFKHFMPLLPVDAKCVFATLSARVGSIGDNQLGGWYSYRASKAALNQIVRTAAIEIARKRPDAICLALHPGTVETALSRRYARGQFSHSPGDAARKLLRTIDRAGPGETGRLLSFDGTTIPW